MSPTPAAQRSGVNPPLLSASYIRARLQKQGGDLPLLLHHGALERELSGGPGAFTSTPHSISRRTTSALPPLMLTHRALPPACGPGVGVRPAFEEQADDFQVRPTAAYMRAVPPSAFRSSGSASASSSARTTSRSPDFAALDQSLHF